MYAEKYKKIYYFALLNRLSNLIINYIVIQWSTYLYALNTIDEEQDMNKK